MVKPDLAALISEGRNPNTDDIDTLPTQEMLRRVNAEDKTVALAVEKVLPGITRAVDRIADGFRRGGRLIYVGAGTSGRLGVLDASECPPTFGVPESMVVGLIAGGSLAVADAIEGAEDDAGQGAADLAALGPTPADVVVGIAASGRTPYVIGALKAAHAAGSATVAIACNEGSAIGALADIAIEPVVGPEALTGSTRMKAGSAQKMVLNMLSTGAMIRIGKTYGNLMVDLSQSNEKLAARAERIVADVARCGLEEARSVLAKAGSDVKLAIMMRLSGLDPEAARSKLDSHGGVLRAALANLDAAP